MLAIIFGLCLIILALIIEHDEDLKEVTIKHDKELKKEYERGFKRGLYYNVVRIIQNNDLEVVSENGVHYK